MKAINLINIAERYYQLTKGFSNKLTQEGTLSRGTANKLESIFVFFPTNNILRLSGWIDDFKTKRIQADINRMKARSKIRSDEIRQLEFEIRQFDPKTRIPKCLKNIHINSVNHSFQDVQTLKK